MTTPITEQLELTGSVLDKIGQVQQWFAQQFEFENLDVLLGNEEPLTEQYVRDKMLEQGRGGLCYELNGLLYLVLRDLGIPVQLAAATIWVQPHNRFALDRTHIVNLLDYEDTLYLVDSGFGNHLAMQPVALDGEAVTSPAGTFRLRSETTEKGTIVFEQQTDHGWERRYALHPDEIEWDHLDNVKQQIHHSPESAFNKSLLIAQVTEDGTYSINDERYHHKGKEGEETLRFKDNRELLDQVRQHAAPAVYETVERYKDTKQ